MAIHYSVIIPTLNEEKYLPNLLESLAAQTQKDFEVIVVDGVSKDNTVAVAQEFKRKLPCLSVLTADVPGVSRQRNVGARNSSGEWLVFVDADSVLLPTFIERISEYIRTEHPKIFTTWTRPDSKKPGDANIALLANMIYEMSIILHRPLAPGPLTIVLRSVFDAVGGYDETRVFNEDVDLSMRLHKKSFFFTVIPETLYTWSMRRLRKEGRLRLLQQYLMSGLPYLFFKYPVRFIPGYLTGGHIYKKKKGMKQTALKRYDAKLKAIMKELFE
jgi:glycosyltransferase involved in cell wall biosynthesis